MKGNTPSIHKDNMSSPLKCDLTLEDMQEHILKCHVLLEELQAGALEAAHSVKYNYGYGDTHAQKVLE